MLRIFSNSLPGEAIQGPPQTRVEAYREGGVGYKRSGLLLQRFVPFLKHRQIISVYVNLITSFTTDLNQDPQLH